MTSLAPRPGVGSRNDRAEMMRQVMTLTLDDDPPVKLALWLVPMVEQEIFEREVGRGYEMCLADLEDNPSALTVARLWWLARRVNGDAFLTWADARDQWGARGLLNVGIDISEPEKGDLHPEA